MHTKIFLVILFSSSLFSQMPERPDVAHMRTHIQHGMFLQSIGSGMACGALSVYLSDGRHRQLNESHIVALGVGALLFSRGTKEVTAAQRQILRMQGHISPADNPPLCIKTLFTTGMLSTALSSINNRSSTVVAVALTVAAVDPLLPTDIAQQCVRGFRE